MAGIGLKYPCFSPFSGEEPANALPTYGTGIVIGKAVSANATPNLAEGQLYADDGEAESARDFTSADVSLETDRLEDNVAVVLYGATLDEETGELVENADDTPPWGGLAYYRVLERNGKRMFRARFYPKARASIGGESAQTRGESITFSPENTNFRIVKPNNGNWRYTYTSDNEQEVIQWINTKLNITAAGA